MLFQLGLPSLFLGLLVCQTPSTPPAALADTKELTRKGDLAAQMVEGIDRYLMRQTADAEKAREGRWKLDYRSPADYVKSLEPHRKRLATILGAADPRMPARTFELVASVDTPALVAETDSYSVQTVRWSVFPGVDGEGLLMTPRGKPLASVIALPDADWSPEALAGLAPGVPAKAQFARRLAENGCQVLIPTLIDRKDTWSGQPRFRMTNQPHREFIYRMAYELGRHIIGFEVQKVLAAVDLLTKEKDAPPIVVFGYGEGGLLALQAGALDQRIKTTVVSGYFGRRDGLWSEPIYRNVWSALHDFGDAELGKMIVPRMLIVESSHGPEIQGPPTPRDGRGGAAPGRLEKRQDASFATLAVRQAATSLGAQSPALLEPSSGLPGDEATLAAILENLGRTERPRPSESAAMDRRKGYDPNERQGRQFQQLVDHCQKLLRQAEERREAFFWSKMDRSSPAAWSKTGERQRDYFSEEVIGKLPAPQLPPNPQSRLAYKAAKWYGYEVTLDLYPDVFAYGILLLPTDFKPGEKRPVVVCQHGLEGRPQDIVDPKTRTKYYNSFGAQLADKGYIVFAPQNPYIGQDKFRVLQRKANPLKLSLFSFIVRQHERILDWLATLPGVDPERMAFYGLSYGGKTAMRVPAILPRYALSICSADFNEWIWKNASVDFRGSYMFSGEYEMVEFDLGNTFGYAEMAGLIAPRPFMVERGHDDGVGIDEWVAYEYAKIRRFYTKLKIPERTEIEFFDGGHEIRGLGTFAFLARHLKWDR